MEEQYPKPINPYVRGSLVKTNDSISVTKKILSESIHEFHGDFTGEPIWRINAHSKSVRKIILSKYYNNIVSASEDGFIKVWDKETGHLLREFKHEENWVCALADVIVNPETDVDYFLFSAGKSGKLFRTTIDDYLIVEDIKAHNLIITDLAISKDNKLVATASWDDRIKIWDIESLQLQVGFIGHNLGVNSIEFIDDKNVLATGGKDEKIKIWLPNGELISELSGHKHWVEVVTYCPNKNILASGSCDNTIKIWNWQEGRCLLTIENEEWINDLTFSEDGNFLVASCYNASVKVFETKNFTQIALFQEHSKFHPFNHSIGRESTNWIYSVLFDDSSNKIFSASSDGCIYKWK